MVKFLLLTIFLLLVLIFPASTYAASKCESIRIKYQGIDPVTQTSYKVIDTDAGAPFLVPPNTEKINILFSGLPTGVYALRFGAGLLEVFTEKSDANDTGNLTLMVDNTSGKLSINNHTATLVRFNVLNYQLKPEEYCEDVKYRVGSALFKEKDCQIQISPNNPTNLEEFRIDLANVSGGTYPVFLNWEGNSKHLGKIKVDRNNGTGSLTVGPVDPPTGKSTISLYNSGRWDFCSTDVNIISSVGNQNPRPIPPGFPLSNPNCRKDCVLSAGQACNPQNGDINGAGGIMTAIGCVPTEPGAFVNALLRVTTAALGGIAFLFMIFGVFQFITSAGNPDGIKKGWGLITNAIIALLFIIFAVLLLKIIGVDLLNIPGFK